jgi:hypothetical protein
MVLSSLRAWLAMRPRITRITLPSVVFVILTVVRVQGISEKFWLLGDQIRDWTIALGSWRDLPLSGTPSTAGGRSLGPVYYWMLWLIRHALGPWLDNLPHAGGIGLCLVQSAADAFLLTALWRRTHSLPFALGTVLLAATSPFDMALTATIWNPPVAVALVKVTMAIMLIGNDRPSTWWVVLASGVAWLSVQAHSSALFVAAPVMASFVVNELVARRWMRALQVAQAIAEVIFVLQIPFLIDYSLHPDEPAGPTSIVANVMSTLSHPSWWSLRVSAAAHGIAMSFDYILLRPWTFPSLLILIVASLVVTAVRVRHDVTLASITVIPLLFAEIGFSTWQGTFYVYWFLTLTPPLVLTVALALTALPWRLARSVTSTAVLVLALVCQPARFAQAQITARLPEYGPLLRGSRELRRRTPELRAIEVTFFLPPSSDPEFLYKLLGGKIAATAKYVATIERTGYVSYRPASEP